MLNGLAMLDIVAVGTSLSDFKTRGWEEHYDCHERQ